MEGLRTMMRKMKASGEGTEEEVVEEASEVWGEA